MHDAIVGGLVDSRADVGDAGKVHDGVDAGEQRRPVDRLAIIAGGDGLHAHAKLGFGALPGGRAHAMTGVGEGIDQGSADEAGGTRDEDPRAHWRTRTKDSSSQATRPTPMSSPAALLQGVTSTTLSAANTTSPTLTRNTRRTISMLVKPLSRAR